MNTYKANINIMGLKVGETFEAEPTEWYSNLVNKGFLSLVDEGVDDSGEPSPTEGSGLSEPERTDPDRRTRARRGQEELPS